MAEFPIKIENVVAVAMLGVDFHLEKMLSSTEGTEYAPEQFPGLVYRPQNLPGVAALIFSSGKIVCTGARSVEAARDAMKKVVEKVRSAGIDVPKDFDVSIENIVARSKIKGQLKLEELALSLENAEYEPSQFPGLVYRIPEPKVSFLLFSTGKIICTGARRVEDIQRGLQNLRQRLEKAGVMAVPDREQGK